MITVVGVSHKTTTLALRERFAFPDQTVAALLAGLEGEALLLVTCNRTELYGTVTTDRLRLALLSAAGVSEETPLFVRHGRDAVRHLLAVAAGLDSMVLGEPQILGQVKAAIAASRRAGRLAAIFDRLGRQALLAGRRVRRETLLGHDRPSIPRVASRVAAGLLGGRDARLLVIGAGKVGGLTAGALRDAGIAHVVVTNRTAAPAQDLARSVGGAAAPFAALDDLLLEADLVISCTGSPAPLLDRQRVEQIMTRRAGRPLVVIDLAVPRDVAAEVRDVSGVRLVDLDDLRERAAAAVPPETLAQAEAIVAEETQAFLHWLAGRQAVPTIRALRQQAETILERELASSGDAERMRQFGRRLLNKMLHHPVVRLRDRAGTHGTVYLDVARDLFALDGDSDD